MSGSSESSISGAGGGFRGPDEPCADLTLRRMLEAPVAEVVAALVEGAVLDLALEDGPPPVVALTLAGALAGSIVPTGRLLECLRSGVAFQAIARSIDGGAVRLEVKASP